MKHNSDSQPYEMAGLFTLSLRLVVGWTYFSAFWRRVILENKLIPEEAGYIGEKFNHFLPNALGIKPLIEYLVTHPDQLQGAMIAFTIVEAIVGLFVMLGLFTRLMGIGVSGLAMGILLGSGWLGTTCLDEWQIGVLGIAGGFTLFLTGSGRYSADHYVLNIGRAGRSKWINWLASGPFPLHRPHRFVLVASVFIFALTLYTNQYFHGGVWGRLHNKSVKPRLEISHARLDKGQLYFRIYRTEGADVYGSFLIGIELTDMNGKSLFRMGAEELALFPEDKIRNHYIAKIRPGKHSLVVPLGAKADLSMDIGTLSAEKGRRYLLKLTDVSGVEWVSEIYRV